MPRSQAISHQFPDRCFYEIRRPPSGETAFDLLNAGDLSPGPDLLYRQHDLSKGRKRLASGMQKDQVVVALFGQGMLGANPEDPSSDARQASCGLCLHKIAFFEFIILHACLRDEKGSIGEHSDRIWQVVMGLPFKCVADGKGRILGGWQPVGLCKCWSNVASRIADHLGMVFKPEKEAFFDLATKRLAERKNGIGFETGNPARNGATCNFEQIDPINSRCNHWYLSCPSDK